MTLYIQLYVLICFCHFACLHAYHGSLCAVIICSLKALIKFGFVSSTQQHGITQSFQLMKKHNHS